MNKIYRVIWNSTLRQWTVTSELGRGHIKRATNKTLAALAIPLLLSASVQASQCNSTTLVCDLDKTWSAATNNNGVGTVTIADGKTYKVNGPDNFKATFGSHKSYTNINDLINSGYVDGELIPDDHTKINLGNKSKNITVIDPITNSPTVLAVYDSASILELSSGFEANGFNVAKTGPVNIYNKSTFVKVTNGMANLDMGKTYTLQIAGRNSEFVFVDGRGGDNALANWTSSNKINFSTEMDFAANPTQTVVTTRNQYKGSFTAFDGSTQTVNSISDFKAYNDWLIGQVSAGKLSYKAYEAELKKSYITTQKNYVVNRLSAGVDPILLEDPGVLALLSANGANATVRLSETGKLVGDPRGSGILKTSLFRLQNGATGINDGEIDVVNSVATVLTGSKFINNNKIMSGNLTGGGVGRASYVNGTGSEFINNGTINLAPTFWSTIYNAVGYASLVIDGGKFTNNGVFNLGITEGTKGRNVLGYLQGIQVSTRGQMLNSVNGRINMGFDEAGNAIYLKSRSAGIYVYGTGATVDNQGTITLGSKVEGSYGIQVNSAGDQSGVVNSGTINLLADGEGGIFVPQQNIGILVEKKAKGVRNTGTINVQGVNALGLKAQSGGTISSSGTINVTSNSHSGDVRNYGVWAEGADSSIDISGTVNLKGDGTIGVHARNGGEISLSGNGSVTFTDGEDQIGYYIYGAGSKISNSGSGTQDVTTNNSTLMRLDGGASFTGSSGATSVMSASGDNAKVIVASGKGTNIDSGGMTVNVNGNQATGFHIEGGATGNIASTATINLSGVGAIAGIADGQGYNLAGVASKMSDADKKATRLVSAADLNSVLNNVVGYIARNLATINNSGNISFTGRNATGVSVEEGAVGINSGNISLGIAGVGLSASANTLETRLTNTGSLTLNGNWGGNGADRTVGISATGSKVIVDMKTDGASTPTINLQGNGAVGIKAAGGSVVNLDARVATQFNTAASDQIAFWVSGKAADGTSSKINITGSTVANDVASERSVLMYVDEGASLTGKLNAKVSGKDASAMKVSGNGSQAVLGAGSSVEVSGQGANAVFAENQGQAEIASGANFVLNGSGGTIGVVQDSGSKISNGASVTSKAGSSGSTAFIARDGGELVNTGNIDLSLGANHVAIDVNNGTVSNTGSIKANGTAIHIQGANAVINNSGSIEATDGRAAIELGSGASLNLAALSGNGTIKASGTADGILLSTGAVGLNVSNTTIDMSASNSSGVGINNVAGISGIKLDNTHIKVNNGKGIRTAANLDASNSGIIDVAGGIGIAFENQDGSATNNNLDLSASQALTINVNGAGGQGIVANLTGTNRSVDSAVNVNVTSTTGGSALNVSGAKTIAQRGNLISQAGNVLNAGNATELSNSGKIIAGDRTKNAIVMNGSVDKTLTNSGTVVGQLNLVAGSNTVTLSNGSNIDGDILLGSGINNSISLTGALNTLIGNISALGNSTQVSLADNANMTGNVVLANGNNQVTLTDSAAINGNLSLGNGINLVDLSGNSSIGNLNAKNGGQTLVTITGNGSDSPRFGVLDAGTGGAVDRLTFDHASYTMGGSSTLRHFDEIVLNNGSVFTTADVLQMGDTASSIGQVTIDATSKLDLTPLGDYSFSHKLLGNGLVLVSDGDRFSFGSQVGTGFTGSVELHNSDFDLVGDNTRALTNARLVIANNNTTKIGSGIQTIGGLFINGGTLNTDQQIVTQSGLLVNHINVTGTLDVSGTGAVRINNGGFANDAPVVSGSKTLLDQQGAINYGQIAIAGSVTGSAGALELQDENGEVISNDTATDISQNGVKAAEGIYDFGLSTHDGSGVADGLYVSYGLTALNLLRNDGNKLVITTAGSTQKDLAVKLTGVGGLGIDAGNETLTISNTNNDYQGVTELQSGTLKIGVDNALGNTSELILNGTTIADLNGKTQSIGGLTGQANSTLNLNNGHLTLLGDSTSSGSLNGDGQLEVDGGTLTVNNANSALSADVDINSGATVLLNHLQGLGSSLIAANGDLTLNTLIGKFTNRLAGAGQFNLIDGSDVALTGNNQNFTGALTIDGNSHLTLSTSENVGGATAIQNANRLTLNNTNTMLVSAIVSGTGSIAKTDAGLLTLSGNNTYSGKTQIKGGTLAISQDSNLGDGSATNQVELDGGTLQLAADMTSDRKVTLVQDGSMLVDSGVTAGWGGWQGLAGAGSANTLTKLGDGTLIFTGDNSANTGDVVVNGGTLQVSDLSHLASLQGNVELGSLGTLALIKDSLNAADDSFSRTLSGSGTLKVNLGSADNTLNFTPSASGGRFTGTVAMDNGIFQLDSIAESVLSQGTLQLNGNGSEIGSTTLTGDRQIGGLVMNGGHINVDYDDTTNQLSGSLSVDHLDVSGGGSLSIDLPETLPNPMPDPGKSLFDQDDAGLIDKIVSSASTVVGSGTQLQLLDGDGNALTNDTIIGLEQNGVTAGEAHYNYTGSVTDDGIYLAYTLTEVKALDGQSVILNNHNAVDNKLGAKLTGSGGFTVDASGDVYIGNAASNYTGETVLSNGNLILLTDKALGNTSKLSLNAGTNIDFNGNSQTIGQLNGLSGSNLDLNEGTLTITDGGVSNGNLQGNGQIVLAGGSLTINGNNNDLEAQVSIDDGAEAVLTHAQGLGQVNIVNEGLLTLSGASGTLLNSIRGTDGQVKVTNGAEITLGANNQNFAGSFKIETASKLIANALNQLGSAAIDIDNGGSAVLDIDTIDRWVLINEVGGDGTLVKAGAGTLQIDGSNIDVEHMDIQNGLVLVGFDDTNTANLKAANLNIGVDGTLGGYGTVTGTVTNGGSLLVGGALNGDGYGSFTIDGDYVGNNGTIYFTTVLAGDDSDTDLLNITGSTSGNSYVVVNNMGGHGEQTADGIKLIDVAGDSNGMFRLQGRAVAGAYEYFLTKGGADGHWYLRSDLLSNRNKTFRPENGAYIANASAANELFNVRLEDRQGGPEDSSMWLRMVNTYQRSRDTSGQLRTADRRYVVQGGGEFLSLQSTDSDRIGLGFMAGYGNSSSETRSAITGYNAKGHAKGYSLGLYATWYQDDASKYGAYVDSWAQYSWFKNDVSGEQLAKESYNSDGYSASIEAGYRKPVYESKNGRVVLQPQAQVTWSDIRADSRSESNGTKMESSGHGNLQTRLGVRVAREGRPSSYAGTDRLYRPYAEVNWLHNTKAAGVRLDGVLMEQSGARNVGEVKLGLEGQINSKLNLWANVGQQMGGDGYNNTTATFGVKYTF